jgi:hypothetical protein
MVFDEVFLLPFSVFGGGGKCVLGMEPRALRVLGKHFITELHPSSSFQYHLLYQFSFMITAELGPVYLIFLFSWS